MTWLTPRDGGPRREVICRFRGSITYRLEPVSGESGGMCYVADPESWAAWVATAVADVRPGGASSDPPQDIPA